MLFQLLLFFKKLFKAPTREFIVFNCCSCTRLKFAVNELISLRCSSMPENDALNGLLLVAFARSLLLLLARRSLLSSCSFSFGFFSIFAVFVFSDLFFIVYFHNVINTRAGACLSNLASHLHCLCGETRMY